MASRWDKIRSLSASEIAGRAAQYLNRQAEQTGFFGPNKEISDREFLSHFRSSQLYSSTELFDRLRVKTTPNFYTSFTDRGATISKLAGAAATAGIIQTADEICAGTIRLLGIPSLKFDRGNPDWHYEPISGKRSPLTHWSKIVETSAEQTGDKKVIWELNRHQYFIALGQAYWLTGDEKYAKAFVEHIESWMDQNPPKIGVNWLSSLELAFRSISWIWAYHFFKDSPAFTSDLFQRMLKFLYLNGRHIETYLSTYFSPNTHLTGEALGLYFLGSFIPELKEASRWKSKGYKILIDALDFQVRPDGTYCEQASHYLRYTIDFYCNLLILRRLEDSRDESKIEQKLNQLFDYLLHITLPNGQNPNFGDDDGGRFYFFDDRPVTDFRPTLALGAVLLNRGDLKFLATEPTSELLWLTSLDGLRAFDEIKAFAPPERIKAFPDGGFFTARSDWSKTADHIVIDCGPHGFMNGGHAHADALSFVLALNGQPVFIDSGTYNYTSEPAERDRFRATSAHNCLTINGESSSVPQGPFSWKSTANARLLEWCEVDEGVHFRGTHDGYRSMGVKYEREIYFGFNGKTIISEHIESSRENTFQVNFILVPSFKADIIDDSSRLRICDRSGLEILTMETSINGQTKGRGKWAMEEWFVSSIYGAKVKSERLVLSVEASGDFQITTSITKILNNRVGQPSDQLR